MLITGSGFLHGAHVTVNTRNLRTGTVTPLQTGSDLNGVVQSVEHASGSSDDSLIIAATDGREDLADLTKSLWSNVVTIIV
jgi:hypothetical protein